MKQTRTYIDDRHGEYFKTKGNKVAIFQNILGQWVACGFCRMVEADSKEEAIAAYKAKDK